ncbi:MAG: serine/threonine protein kinase [Actinomycetia bacterium]|nr:serine/threonine protein kinase [Actinomycetes bacterium]
MPGVPPALDQLTLDLLEKNPNHRPQDAGQVVDRLQDASQLPPQILLQDILGEGRLLPRGPHVDLAHVDLLHESSEQLRQLTAEHGLRDSRTLEAYRQLAKQTGRSGDVTGALRMYDEVADLFKDFYGPYDHRTLEVQRELNRWMQDTPETSERRLDPLIPPTLVPTCASAGSACTSSSRASTPRPSFPDFAVLKETSGREIAAGA